MATARKVLDIARAGNGASAWGRIGDGWISMDYVRGGV